MGSLKHIRRPYLESLFISLILISTVVSHAVGGMYPLNLPLYNVKDPVLLKAQEYLMNADAQRAASIYQAIKVKDPYNWYADLGLANLAQRDFDYPLAISLLQESISEHPDEPEILAALASAYHRASKYPWVANKEGYSDAQADAWLQEAENLDPEHPAVLSTRAEMQIDTKEWSEAAINLKGALSQEPNYLPAIKQEIRLFVAQRHYGLASDALKRLMELSPQDTEAYYLTALTMKALDRPKQAVHFAKLSQQYDFGMLPERDELLAEEYERLGDLKAAKPYLEQMQVYRPNDPKVMMSLANSDRAEGNEESSIARTLKVFELEPERKVALFSEAENLTRQIAQQPSSAKAAFNLWIEAHRLFPAEPIVYHGLSNVQYQQFMNGSLDPELAEKTRNIIDKGIQGHDFSVEESERLTMDLVKVDLALTGQVDSLIRSQLEEQATQGQDLLASGEAFFLLGEYGNARSQWEQYDTGEALQWLLAGDRLLAIKELEACSDFLKYGFQLEPNDDLFQGMAIVKTTKQQAADLIKQGNAFYTQERYQKAQVSYERALRLYPQSSSLYLKLGDTLARQKDKKSSYAYLAKAVRIQPSLLNSVALSKRLKKLKKRYGQWQVRVLPGQTPQVIEVRTEEF